MSESQTKSTGNFTGYSDPLTVRLSDPADKTTTATPQSPVPDGTPARLPMDVCDGCDRRICQLEARLEALENKLDSAIMQLSRTFGSGQAALQKVK